MSLLRRMWDGWIGALPWGHGSPVLAAGHGPRWEGFKPLPMPKEAIVASRQLVMSRARSLVMSNALAASGCEAWVSGLIGTGIVGRSAHPNEGARKRIDGAWGRFVRNCDADGRLDFAGLQSLIARRVVVDGECIILLLIRDGRLKLRVLDGEQLSPITQQLPTPAGHRVVNGVEYTRDGVRCAFWVFDFAPGQLPVMQPRRIAAADVLHIFRQDFPGQVRGLSWFAPVLFALKEHAKLSDAQLMQMQVASLLTGFVRSLDGDASTIFGGDKRGDRALPTLEPGTMVGLNPQEEVTFSTPPRVTGGELVKKSVAREIAAGLGIPYESLTNDLESVNFSSIRASLVEWRRKCEALQNGLFIAQCFDPIFARFVTTEVLSGRMYAPGDLNPYVAAKWFPPKWAWVDPEKDMGANILSLQNGLTSRTEILSELGRDAAEVDLEIAADQAREKALGLNFQQTQTPVSESVKVRP